MTQTRTTEMTSGRFRHLPLALALFLAMIMVSGASSEVVASTQSAPSNPQGITAQELPSRSEDPAIRTYAPTDLLSEGRQTQLNGDLHRLVIKGVEPVIFMRYADDAATSSPTLAEDIRLGWPVETAPGADDGLVVVISVDRTDPALSSIQFSYGTNVPTRLGLSPEDLEAWAQQQILPGVRTENYLDTLSFGIRELNGTIFDQVGLLTERQRNVLNGDINRLQRLGVPSAVYIETSDDSSLSPQDRANELRASLNVNSSPDADDGLLFLVTVDLEVPDNSTFTVSTGGSALPIRQLEAETLESIIVDHVMPNVQQGNEYVGIAHAVRRTINFAEYSAPIPPPLTSAQASSRLPLNIAAAILLQLAVIGYLLIPALVDGGVSFRLSRRASMIYMAILAPVAVLVGAFGIIGRNPAAALVGLGVFVMATILIPLFTRPNGDPPRSTIPPPHDTEDHSGAHDASPAH